MKYKVLSRIIEYKALKFFKNHSWLLRLLTDYGDGLISFVAQDF